MWVILIAGECSVPEIHESLEGIKVRMTQFVTTIITFVFTLICSVTSYMSKRFQNEVSQTDGHNLLPSVDPITEGEFRPPSPAPAFTEAVLLSCIMRKLGELEEKVSVLQAKPFEMPSEKDELLNAAVCRVDALEAELIVTKKVSSFNFLFIL